MKKEGIKRNRNISGSSNSTTSPPMKKPVTVSNLSKDEVFSSVTTSNATADDEFKTKVTVLEYKLENLIFEHTKVVLEYEELKQAVIQLKKEDNLKKNEVKKLVDENKN